MLYYFIFIPIEKSYVLNLRLFAMLFFSQFRCPKPELFIFFPHVLNSKEGISIYLVFNTKYFYKHQLISISNYKGFPLFHVFDNQLFLYKHLMLSDSFLKGVFLENSQIVFSNYSFKSLLTILKQHYV